MVLLRKLGLVDNKTLGECLTGDPGKGRRGFCEGIQNVADGSEAMTNCSGVRSCGRLPFENAPNGSNRWGLECMDFGAVPAYVVGNTCINMRFSRVMKTGDWIKQL